MTIKILTCSIMTAAMMLTSVSASAWSNDHSHDYRNHHVDYKQIEKLKKQQAKDHQQYHKQLKKQQAARDRARQKAHHQAAKQYAAQNHWQRGNYIPVQYRAPRYVVNDWRAYRLSAPARGHEWRRIDGRYVQVSRHNYQIYQVW